MRRHYRNLPVDERAARSGSSTSTPEQTALYDGGDERAAREMLRPVLAQAAAAAARGELVTIETCDGITIEALSDRAAWRSLASIDRADLPLHLLSEDCAAPLDELPISDDKPHAE